MAASELWTTLAEHLIPLFADYRGRISELPVELKADRTLLTEADIAVQALIVDAIRAVEPGAVVIAEEDERTEVRQDVLTADGRLWVIDPIDGTAEFVQPGHDQFCSVVCLLEDWRPRAAFVLAPELGAGGVPLVIEADSLKQEITVNGRIAERPAPSGVPHVSVTRSGGVAQPFDEILAAKGYQLKIQATSQTLDMVRTVISLAELTDPPLPGFELFWRRKQKVWDGLAGMCLGKAAGLEIVDATGAEPAYGPALLSEATPVFGSTVVGEPGMVSWFLDAAR